MGYSMPQTYNSGAATMGFANGYVDTVLLNAMLRASRMQSRMSIRLKPPGRRTTSQGSKPE
jgi:hypothetical protein